MQARPSSDFGKRNVPAVAAPLPAQRPGMAAMPDNEQAAFFRDAWSQGGKKDAGPLVVPRSFRAALLAGLVTGCCLVGLDIQHNAGIDPALAPLLKMGGLDGAATQALPYMIALSLLGGARLAATILLIAHKLLAWAGQTRPLAYALGGGGLTAAYAALVATITSTPPRHGWAIEIAAGAGAGFLYRVFAGATRR